MQMKKTGLLATACLVLSSQLAIVQLAKAEEAPKDLKALWQLIQQQQQQIEALQQQLGKITQKVDNTKQQLSLTSVKVEKSRQKLDETQEKLEAAAAMIDQSQQVVSNSKSPLKRTHVGGYGELHYNNLDSKEQLDFHRFVLFFGHEFNDWISFYSELEVEHAFIADSSDGGSPGEVELEQAFINFQFNDNLSAKAGLFLVPVGILNETHEPPTFYGVERNSVEKNIIPSTWWEGGVMLSGHTDNGWHFDGAITSGLEVPTTGSNAFKIRKGRQKVAKASAEDGALTGRIKWTGMPGVELATTLQYQQDITQGELGTAAFLFETHGIFNRGPFGLRVLYAQWDLDGPETELLGRDQQEGYYIEPSFKIRQDIGLFARYSAWDNEAGNSSISEKRQFEIGLNYWPHPDVVLKFDYMNLSGAADDKGFNLGIGYQF